MKKAIVFKNENGFLLVEHLIAILIVAILMQVFFCCVKLTELYRYDEHGVSQTELEMVNSQLQKEIKSIQKLSATPNQLFLHQNASTTITYKLNEGKLIRQVNGVGGEVLLYHCQTLDVELIDEQSAYLHLKTRDQKNYSMYVTTFYNPLLLPDLSSLAEEELIIEDFEFTDQPLVEDEIDSIEPLPLLPDYEISPPNEWIEESSNSEEAPIDPI